jgi:DNA-binding MarR family transcriptional regulator
MNDKIIKQLDMATGELLEGCLVYVPYRPKFYASWFMMFQDTLIEIAKDREITGEVYRVLLYLLSQMDFENHIHVSQSDTATILGLQKTNVSRAVKTLCDKGILLKGQKQGRSAVYKLNSHYGWKGKVKNFQSERRQRLTLLKGGAEKTDNTESESIPT